MSTNCSRTSFCLYSPGSTKTLFYTAAFLYSTQLLCYWPAPHQSSDNTEFSGGTKTCIETICFFQSSSCTLEKESKGLEQHALSITNIIKIHQKEAQHGVSLWRQPLLSPLVPRSFPIRPTLI